MKSIKSTLYNIFIVLEVFVMPFMSHHTYLQNLLDVLIIEMIFKAIQSRQVEMTIELSILGAVLGLMWRLNPHEDICFQKNNSFYFD